MGTKKERQPILKQDGVRSERVNGQSNLGHGRNKTDKYHSMPVETRPAPVMCFLLYGLAAVGLYIYTMYPSIAGGDSGELIVAAHELGVAHPPGYPLFTMLMWLWFKIVPYGSVAWRANLLNAFFSGLASLVFALALYRYTSSVGCSVLGAVIWGFGKLTWTWASNAEVFGLNNLFLAALLYLMVKFQDTPVHDKPKVSKIGALVSGLSLCNQHTLVVYVGFIAVWVMWELHQSKILTLRLMLQLGVYGMLGVVPYIYLPLSAYCSQGRWTWGDQRTLQGFLKHFLRQEYGTFDLAKGGSQESGLFVMNLSAYVSHTWSEFTMVWGVFCIIGGIAAVNSFWSRQERSHLVAMLMCGVYLAFFSWRANLSLTNPLFLGVVERFWMQADCVYVLTATVGLSISVRYITQKFKMLDSSNLGTGVMLVLCALQVQQNFNACNQSNNTLVADFGSRLMHNFPQKSLVLTYGDLPSNIFRYLSLCEGQRPDVQIFDQEIMTYKWSYPMLGTRYPYIRFLGHHLAKGTGYIDQIPVYNMKTFLDANVDRGPIIACIGMQKHEASWKQGYELIPFGPCFWLAPKAKGQFGMEDAIHHTLNMTKNWKYPYSGYPTTTWEKVANDEMWNAKVILGLHLYNEGTQKQSPQEHGPLFIRSYQIYRAAIESLTFDEIPSYYHKNYALVCERLLRLDHKYSKAELLNDTIAHFQAYMRKEPQDKDNGLIAEAVENFKTYIGRL